jgi:hypothetical protein
MLEKAGLGKVVEGWVWRELLGGCRRVPRADEARISAGGGRSMSKDDAWREKLGELEKLVAVDDH